MLRSNIRSFGGIGGDTGKVDTFSGVDITDLIGGVINSVMLLEGDNAVCWRGWHWVWYV